MPEILFPCQTRRHFFSFSAGLHAAYEEEKTAATALCHHHHNTQTLQRPSLSKQCSGWTDLKLRATLWVFPPRSDSGRRASLDLVWNRLVFLDKYHNIHRKWTVCVCECVCVVTVGPVVRSSRQRCRTWSRLPRLQPARTLWSNKREGLYSRQVKSTRITQLSFKHEAIRRIATKKKPTTFCGSVIFLLPLRIYRLLSVHSLMKPLWFTEHQKWSFILHNKDYVLTNTPAVQIFSL